MPDAVTDTAQPRAARVMVAPVPTDEEAAAIVAALDALWPQVGAAESVETPRSTAWRFSSRNWARPLPVRRLRPWR